MVQSDQIINQNMMDFIYRIRSELDKKAKEAKNKKRVPKGEIAGTEYKKFDDDDDEDDYNPDDEEQNSSDHQRSEEEKWP